MGAWGHGTFENDDALDWVIELEQDGHSAIMVALSSVTEEAEDYLEASECCNALAAAEVVAAMNGKPLSSPPEEVVTWIVGKPKPDADLLAKARDAVQAVVAGSELKELWEENEEDFPDWKAAADDLLQRLS